MFTIRRVWVPLVIEPAMNLGNLFHHFRLFFTWTKEVDIRLKVLLIYLLRLSTWLAGNKSNKAFQIGSELSLSFRVSAVKCAKYIGT